MQCQTCGLALDPQQVAQTGRCPRCGTPVQSSAFSPPSGGYGQAPTYGQPPAVSGPPQSGFGAPPPPYGAPPQPGFGAPPQQGFGGPPPTYVSQPNFGAPPPPYGAPGVLGAPPQKSRTGLYAIIAVVLVVIIVGAVVAVVLAKKGGSNSSSSNSCTVSGFTTFNSPDNTFCLAYPSDWKATSPSNGKGAEFTGPAQQFFAAANVGSVSGTVKEFDDAFCTSAGGTANPTSTVTIGGQSWTQEQCDIAGGAGTAVVEGVIYKGAFFYIDYASLGNSFTSNKSQFFTPMEQSFSFLS